MIDFYASMPRPGGPPAAMFMDVRPALDNVGAAWDRITMQVGNRNTFSKSLACLI